MSTENVVLAVLCLLFAAWCAIAIGTLIQWLRVPPPEKKP